MYVCLTAHDFIAFVADKKRWLFSQNLSHTSRIENNIIKFMSIADYSDRNVVALKAVIQIYSRIQK